MSYKIKSIGMEGIRGINNPVSIDLNEGLTVIHGPNGTGKSSILQAVEWGLTGDIPYMSGGDFTKEDAIVNAFSRSKNANVRLTFTGPQEVSLNRTKKQGRSTKSGKKSLVLDADKSYQDDDAETFIEQIMNFDLEEASRSKFLHQETIREALTYKPTERSAVIEKLLGTYDIKEFSKALDQKRNFSSELSNIETRLQALQRDRIQFIINLRRDLDDSKNKLLINGYGQHQLQTAYVLKELKEIRGTLDLIAEKYESSVDHPDLEPSIDSLMNANKQVLEDITFLDRKRMDYVTTREVKINKIRMMVDTYSAALENFKDYETLDVDGLTKERDLAKEKIGELSAKYEESQNKLSVLPSRIASYQSDKTDLTNQQEALEAAILAHGDETKLNNLITESEKRIKEIESELARYSGQQRVINLAVDLIESTQHDQCPVCSQPINPQTIVAELKSKVSSEISDKISELTNNQNAEKTSIRECKEKLLNIERANKAIIDLEQRQIKAKNAVEALIGAFTDDSVLTSIQGDMESIVQEIRQNLTELESLFNELNGKISQFNHLTGEISDNRKNLQTETGSILEGQELVKDSKTIIETLKNELNTRDDTSEIDLTRKQQAKLVDILGYLEDQERTEKAERDLPALEEQKQELVQRKTNLTLLQGALSSIRGIVTTYQKESSLQQIMELEDSMNETYQAIDGHPYFSRLKIDIEKEDPLQFSFRAASDKESTYIPTKFSTAQLNIAALSIFMANSKLLAGGLPLITLDDPTQNMDSYHKQEFAKFISTLVPYFQVIIATEDDETRDQLLDQCTTATCYELTEWSPLGLTFS